MPLLANEPLQLPDAVHPVVFADDQVIVVEAPTVIDEDDNVNDGAAGTVAGIMVAAVLACTNPDPTKLLDDVVVVPTVAVVATPLPRSAV